MITRPRPLVAPRRPAPAPPVATRLGASADRSPSKGSSLPAHAPMRMQLDRIDTDSVRSYGSQADRSYSSPYSPLSDYDISPSEIRAQQVFARDWHSDDKSYATGSWASMADDPTQVVLVIERGTEEQHPHRGGAATSFSNRDAASPSRSSSHSGGDGMARSYSENDAAPSFLAPRLPFARSPSPAASVSTVATVRGFVDHHGAESAGVSKTTTALRPEGMTASQMMIRARKRQSSQRRLDSLKGLVADLDLSNPWEQDKRVPDSQSRIEEDCPSPATPTRRQVEEGQKETSQTNMKSVRTNRDRVVAVYGSEEIKRQEVIWELEDTERSFIESMEMVDRLFAAPLRTAPGQWMAGIPPLIVQIFDQAERIAAINRDIFQAVHGLRYRTSYVDLTDFASIFDRLISRFLEYEWYIIHFDQAVAEIENTTRNAESFLGEFFRLQTRKPEMGSLTLASVLLKPVQRLMRYPLFFQRLIELTDVEHHAHSILCEDLDKMQRTILDLQESKARFDDLKVLEQLEAQLFGLPANFQLASPGRKLVGCGNVTRVSKQAIGLGFTERTNSIASSQRSALSSSRSSVVSNDTFWTIPESAARSSTFSQWSSSSGSLSRAGSIQKSSGEAACPPMTRSTSNTSSIRSFNIHGNSGTTSPRRSRKNAPVMLFVFNDLLIAATATEKPAIFGKGRKTVGWQVLPSAEGGIGRVLNHQDWSGWNGHGSLFSVKVLPAHSDIGEELAPITNCYTLPPVGNQSAPLDIRCPMLAEVPAFLTALSFAAPGVFISQSAEKGEEVLNHHHLELDF